MASRRDGRGPHPSLSDCAVQRLLADAQQTGRLAGTDQVFALAVTPETSPELLHVLWAEPAMAAWSDQRRLEPAPGDGTKNGRPADAEAIC
jgi:hypothetical protein